MYVCVLPAYINIPRGACSASGDQKGASDTLELELWMVASHLVGAGNCKLIFSKSSQNF